MTRATLAARALAAFIAALVPATLIGASPEWADALSGRLRQIKETRVVRVGYRADAIPFSYAGPDGRPLGYSLDLCAAIVATIGDGLGGAPLAVDYVPVTAQDRVAKVVSGAVDLECGATTNNAERRREVAFSPVVFVTGTRIAVMRGSGVRDAYDLRGRSVALVAGTTTETAIRDFDRLNALDLRFVPVGDYRAALSLSSAAKVDALAADDVLLRGLLIEAGRTSEVRLVGDLLSFEPYGIMFGRDDPALAGVVLRSLTDLAESREILWIYDRWFVRKLPGRGALALPMGAQLRRSLELIGLPAD